MNWGLLVDLLSALIRNVPGLVESVMKIIHSGELSEEAKAAELELLKAKLADDNTRVQSYNPKQLELPLK